jgi:hypothetical protein
VTLAEYFRENRYKPTFEMGDRVYGKHEGVPFIGTVGNDTEISIEEGPRVSVHLDLPFPKSKSRILIVKPKTLKRLKSYD